MVLCIQYNLKTPKQKLDIFQPPGRHDEFLVLTELIEAPVRHPNISYQATSGM